MFETQHRPPRILFIGNSITYHVPLPEAGWNGSWGMAATSRDNDYVHRTLRRLADAGVDLEPVFLPLDCIQCDGIIGQYLENAWHVPELGPRYVVVQLGENSNDIEAQGGRLTAQYRSLLQALAQYHSGTLFCVSDWGERTLDGFRNTAIRQAMKTIPTAKLVDITAVTADSANYGDPALFPNAGVRWHPGDAGMDGISKALAESILAER
jgi:hypothetical protein